MELTFACPNCGAVNRAPSVESAPEVVCRACGQARGLRPEAFEEGRLRSCSLCATEDLYVQKDFPQGLGLLIVFVGFGIATVFWYWEWPILTYLVFLGSALLDMVLYYRVPNVTICYRCLAQYRGDGANPDGRFPPFDLAIGERYRQERLRAEQLRAENRQTPADSVPPT
jgi:ribosomal protein L40E